MPRPVTKNVKETKKKKKLIDLDKFYKMFQNVEKKFKF